MVEALPLTQSDVKGDIYEYLLSKLTTAGINGQFRTPRHIIDAMIELIDPQPTETVCVTQPVATPVSRPHHGIFKPRLFQ